ncbi:MAG: rod shape-determining protein MreC [Verrucomicrobiota bacterium]
MPLGSDRYASRADTAVVVVCLVLSLVALALPAGLREPIAGALRRTVLLPVLGLQRATIESAESRARLSTVRAQRDSLVLETMFLPELRAENERLRALLGLAARLGHGFTTAEVLHQAGVADGLTLVLSAGRDAGVEPFATVVAADGVLGLVQVVDTHTAVALAWTHPDFRASAMVEGTDVYGIVRARRGARSGELMELIGVPYREQLSPGTRVVTSGLGGIFPRGIPLGTVQGILSEAAGWERTYLLQPSVHPAEARHVIVLAPERSADSLQAAFDSARAGSDSVLVVRDSTGIRAVPLPPRVRRPRQLPVAPADSLQPPVPPPDTAPRVRR